MLQLTFRATLPCPLFTTHARDAYLALKSRGDARLRDGSLNVTLLDLGVNARSRYRVTFECVGTTDSSIRVITEAADKHAALRSGMAVMLGSCAASVCSAGRTRAATGASASALSAAVCS